MVEDSELLDAPRIAPAPIGKGKGVVIIVLTVLLIVAYAGADLFAFLKIRTIIVSGPIILGFSLILLVVALIQRHIDAIVLVAVGVINMALLFVLINFFELSPSEARQPVPLIGLVLTFIFTLLGVRLILKINKRWNEQLMNR